MRPRTAGGNGRLLDMEHDGTHNKRHRDLDVNSKKDGENACLPFTVMALPTSTVVVS